MGYQALNATTSSYNTGVGTSTLYYNTTGSYNTAIGYQAGYANANNLTNTVSIGYYARCTASNQVRIGDGAVSSIGGYANWTNISDGRTKKNIRAEVPGLAFINLLQPVMYNLDLDAIDELMKSDDPEIRHFTDSLRMALSPEDKEILAKAKANKEKQVYSGFVAQDVEKAALTVGYDFSGVDAPENGKDTYGLRYAEFVVPLVKAVQELSKQVEELTAKLEELTISSKSPNAGIIDENDDFKNVSFSLFPNPTSGFFTVDYTLNIDAPICFELFNMFGQRIKLITPQQNQKAGTYSVQVSVGDLGTGSYVVKATSGNHVVSKQLIINH
jgi:hypothetical protein